MVISQTQTGASSFKDTHTSTMVRGVAAAVCSGDMKTASRTSCSNLRVIHKESSDMLVSSEANANACNFSLLVSKQKTLR